MLLKDVIGKVAFTLLPASTLTNKDELPPTWMVGLVVVFAFTSTASAVADGTPLATL